MNLQVFGMQGVPVADLVDHYASIGTDVEPVLKKLSIDCQSYACGPGALTRIPGINQIATPVPLPLNDFSGRGNLLATANKNSSILPPPLLAGVSMVNKMNSFINSESPIESQTEQTSPSSCGDSTSNQNANYACQKVIGKSQILVYSCDKSIEQRRLENE